MGITAAGVAAAATAASAAASIGTSAAGAAGAFDPSAPDVEIQGGGNPLADPLLSAATQNALIQIGVPPDPTVASQGSPIAVALSKLLEQAAFEPSVVRDFVSFISRVAEAIESGEPLLDNQSDRWRAQQIAGAVGMTPQQLMTAHQEHSVRQQQGIERATEIANLNRESQFGAAEQLAALMGDLPDVSATGLEEYKAQQKERLLRDLNRSVDEASLGAVRQANFANYNPGRVLGDLEEARIRGTQDADLSALEYALGALGGQQNIAAGRSGLLQNFLAAPGQASAQLSAIRAGSGFAPLMFQPQQVQAPGFDFGSSIQAGQSALELGSDIADLFS